MLSEHAVFSVKIHNRDFCEARLQNFEIRVGNHHDNLRKNALCYYHRGPLASPRINLNHCYQPLIGRYIFHTWVSLGHLFKVDLCYERLIQYYFSLCSICTYPCCQGFYLYNPRCEVCTTSGTCHLSCNVRQNTKYLVGKCMV